MIWLFRILLTATFFLTLLFSTSIIAIRTRPYDDSALRAFFAASQSCPMPCFLGIRPGATTVEEAMTILQGHDWITSVNRFEATDGRGVTALTATWSTAKPTFIDSSEELWLGVEDNRIQTILITTTVPLGDIWMVLGNPEGGTVRGDVTLQATSPSVIYQAMYYNLDMFFTVVYLCHNTTIWNLPVKWILRHDITSVSMSEDMDLPIDAYDACRRLLNNR